MSTCPVRYWGPTRPGAHGTRCILDEGHETSPKAQRHVGLFGEDGRISWFTEEQKQATEKEQANG